MPRIALIIPLRALVITAAACVAAAGIAAEFSPLSVSEYRLSADKTVASRLVGAQPDAPAPVLPELSAAARLLADRPYANLIEAAARDAALDPALVHAVISVESGYNAAALSPKGAIGLMQVMPETAIRYGVRNAARSPAANLRVGTRYLSDLMQLFDNRLDLVLAAYNAGENTVVRYGMRIPPFPETQQYVPNVLARYRLWREPLPAVAADVAPPPVHIEYMPGTRLEFDSTRTSIQR